MHVAESLCMCACEATKQSFWTCTTSLAVRRPIVRQSLSIAKTPVTSAVASGRRPCGYCVENRLRENLVVQVTSFAGSRQLGARMAASKVAQILQKLGGTQVSAKDRLVSCQAVAETLPTSPDALALFSSHKGDTFGTACHQRSCLDETQV